MRDESTLMLQMIISLTVVFSAFAAGLVIGWLRWARRSHAAAWHTPVPLLVKPDLFAPVGSAPTVDIRRAASPATSSADGARADASQLGTGLLSLDPIDEGEATPMVVRRRGRSGRRGPVDA